MREKEIEFEEYVPISASHEQITEDKKPKEKLPFIKNAYRNPFSKMFVILFVMFLTITIALSIFYASDPVLIGIMMFLLFPYFAGFFFVFIVILLVFQRFRDAKMIDKLMFDKWNQFVIIWGGISCVIIWIIGIINMVIGFWVFVWFIVIGNMNSMIRKDTWIWAKIPANKWVNLIILSLIWIIPLVIFGIYLGIALKSDVTNMNVVVEYLITHGVGLLAGYIAVITIGGICFWIIVFSNKEIGKRVAIFALFFVYTITVWALKAAGSFDTSNAGGTTTELAFEGPIIVITIYNMFTELKESEIWDIKERRGKTKKELKKFDKHIRKMGHKEDPLYRFLSKHVDRDVLDALVFVFFCSAFFGYYTAKVALTTVSATLSLPDLGVLIPNLIQITIALILVIPFLINSVIALRKDFKDAKPKQKRLFQGKKQPFQWDD